MAYAGTFGADETCPHDVYWRSCQYCSTIGPRPTEVQKEHARRSQAHQRLAALRHPDQARQIAASPREVTVYDAVCPMPDCGWERRGLSMEVLHSEMAEHLHQVTDVAQTWSHVNPDEAYVEPK